MAGLDETLAAIEASASIAEGWARHAAAPVVLTGPVATGTVQETIDSCRETLEIMKPGGGYCYAPTHQLQDNSPTENVVAMYETAHKYGRYP